MQTREYFTPECQIVEMIIEGSILVDSIIRDDDDGFMGEGGEI